MVAKSFSNRRVRSAFFGRLFAVIMAVLMLGAGLLTVGAAYADPGVPVGETTTEEPTTGEPTIEEPEETEEEPAPATTTRTESGSCESSLGAIGWLVCPTTGKIAEAVDWLYDKIEEILVVNPIAPEDGTPIYEIWKYFRGLTNILFIVFLLVVIYSQITGYGISNYGIKKALPKLIVAAVLVNLSFIICSVLVDVSNIIGSSLRGVFTTIEETTFATTTGVAHISVFEIFKTLGSGLAIGAVSILLMRELIWFVIPIILGAIVAVGSGLLTISLRQAVVALLIMIAPLAIVAYILPNTEGLFKKWKSLFIRMLVFYPMFSLLFGASGLAGWAIIVAAKDGFGLMLGTAVQIFPLFFSWSLMKMSGTVLGSVNSWVRGLTVGALAANQKWAASHSQNTRARMLGGGRPYLPTTRLRQFLYNRQTARDLEAKEYLGIAAKEGAAYEAERHYRRDGTVSRRGVRLYEARKRGMEYDKQVLQHQINFEEGLGVVNARVVAQNANGDAAKIEANKASARQMRLDSLDVESVKASDNLKFEQARGEMVAFNNARGFHNRAMDMINAHFDQKKSDEEILDPKYKLHFEGNPDAYKAALDRYNSAFAIMGGDELATQYAQAFASHAYGTQLKLVGTKFQGHFDYTGPTKDVEMRLAELTARPDAAELIDVIIPGLRTLNNRGDMVLQYRHMRPLFKTQINENGEEIGGVELGTHASQAISTFLMTEVKNSNPFMRRFGKYINLETAHIYNSNARKKMKVDFEEYVKGYYYNPDGTRQNSKQGLPKLMEGTSVDGIERDAMDEYEEMVMDAYSDENGVIQDYEGFKKTMDATNRAMAPQLISAVRKVLSGSEALTGYVKNITGYGKKQNDDGSYGLKSIFDDEDYVRRLGGHKGDWRQYRKEWAKLYLSALVPSQILSMRTDELQAYEMLLPTWFQEEHPDLHKALEAKLAEDFPDMNPAEREELLAKTESREMFRSCFGRDKLEQVSRTNLRRGVLESKSKLLDLLGLVGDNGSKDKSGLTKYLSETEGGASFDVSDLTIDRIMAELKSIHEQQQAAESGDSADISAVVDRVGLIGNRDIDDFISDVKYRYATYHARNDVEGFYNDTRQLLVDRGIPVEGLYDAEYARCKDDRSALDLLLDKLINLAETQRPDTGVEPD